MLCQCPKLTPLQSRFAASFFTLVILAFVYWSLANPHFAEAGELSFDGSGYPRQGADHNWHRIREADLDHHDGEEGGEDTPLRVVVRQNQASDIDSNDSGHRADIQVNHLATWRYPNSLRTSAPTQRGKGLPSTPGDEYNEDAHPDLRKREGLEKRQGSTNVYISINTCAQPTWSGQGEQNAAPPQLTLYVSSDANNKQPGPNSNLGQIVVPLNEGFANTTVPASGDFYMSVYAPAVSQNFRGGWNYEIAVSLTDYFHAAALDDRLMFLVDADDQSALFVTDNLTDASPDQDIYKQWMDLKAPFTFFGESSDSNKRLGVQNSYCGWSNIKEFGSTANDPNGNQTNIATRMITRGPGKKPKQQFHVKQLKQATAYAGVLALTGDSVKSGSGVVGGGGKVWPVVHWQTKADGNCELLFDMEFCEDVAYAVPSNPSKFNTSQLRTMFDNYTSTYYQQFNYSLQIIPCNTDSEAQYSLAKNCGDCAAAYKEWLCAVSIPRCEDFSNPAPFLQPRNVAAKFLNGTSLSDGYLDSQYIPMQNAPTLPGSPRDTQTYLSAKAANSSRDPSGLIDTQIMPGPYKELLPCEDLCWSLMQSCPAALQFACPLPGRGLEVGYGRRSHNGSLTCSYLGAVYDVNGVSDLAPQISRTLIIALVASFILVAA